MAVAMLSMYWSRVKCLLKNFFFSFRIEFIDQFEVIPVRIGKERASAKKEEPHFGTSFEPSSIYKMLPKIRSETFKVEGRQEDAEEFLSCLLNGLHDEMIDIVKATNLPAGKTPVQAGEGKPGTSDDEDWQVYIAML
jgi:ubiquitin carboxyl-terminal hydrolase 10